MKKFPTICFRILLCVLPCGSLAAEVPPFPGGDFQRLIKEAYDGNPELRAAYARWQAARERTARAGILPDPMIGYGYFVEELNARQIFRVEQLFPGPGKLDSRDAAAAARAETAARILETVAADVRAEVLRAGGRYLLARQSVELLEENLALLEKLQAVANRLYRTGEATQADVLRLESEAESLKVEIESWREREGPLRAEVNAILGKSPDARLPEALTLPDSKRIAALVPSGPETDLRGNPDLIEARSRIREAEEEREVARRESRPDIRLGLEYKDNRSGLSDEVLALVSVNVPIWQGRYRSLRKEASAELRAVEADYDARRDRIDSDLRRVRFELGDALRQERLFERALLPRARQTLDLVEADYKTGRADFLDLLGAQRALLDLEIGHLRATTDVFLRYVDWERLAGPGERDSVARMVAKREFDGEEEK